MSEPKSDKEKVSKEKVSKEKGPEKAPIEVKSKPVKACADEMGKHKKFDKFK